MLDQALLKILIRNKFWEKSWKKITNSLSNLKL